MYSEKTTTGRTALLTPRLARCKGASWIPILVILALIGLGICVYHKETIPEALQDKGGLLTIFGWLSLGVATLFAFYCLFEGGRYVIISACVGLVDGFVISRFLCGYGGWASAGYGILGCLAMVICSRGIELLYPPNSFTIVIFAAIISLAIGISVGLYGFHYQLPLATGLAVVIAYVMLLMFLTWKFLPDTPGRWRKTIMLCGVIASTAMVAVGHFYFQYGTLKCLGLGIVSLIGGGILGAIWPVSLLGLASLCVYILTI